LIRFATTAADPKLITRILAASVDTIITSSVDIEIYNILGWYQLTVFTVDAICNIRS
jgi:hypothetical protein